MAHAEVHILHSPDTVGETVQPGHETEGRRTHRSLRSDRLRLRRVVHSSSNASWVGTADILIRILDD